jgi:hypothetical protein
MLEAITIVFGESREEYIRGTAAAVYNKVVRGI